MNESSTVHRAHEQSIQLAQWLDDDDGPNHDRICLVWFGFDPSFTTPASPPPSSILSGSEPRSAAPHVV